MIKVPAKSLTRSSGRILFDVVTCVRRSTLEWFRSKRKSSPSTWMTVCSSPTPRITRVVSKASFHVTRDKHEETNGETITDHRRRWVPSMCCRGSLCRSLSFLCAKRRWQWIGFFSWDRRLEGGGRLREGRMTSIPSKHPSTGARHRSWSRVSSVMTRMLPVEDPPGRSSS